MFYWNQNLIFISVLALWVLETESLELTVDGYILRTKETNCNARWSADISLEATKSRRGYRSLTRFRFEMDLYTNFAPGRRIAAWNDFHLSHYFDPGVPWWLHGTLRRPKKKNIGFSVQQFFNTIQVISQKLFDLALE